VLSATELAFQEWEIIGRSSEKEKLVKELMSGGDGSALAVVSVWGMGGMGKSSLVSMARTDPELLDAYDCSAWVTVPHPLDNTYEFMRRLRKQLGLGAAAHDENDDDDDDIKEHLKEKRYLIVVDDLLKRDEWDQVRPKLFNFQNAKGSRGGRTSPCTAPGRCTTMSTSSSHLGIRSPGISYARRSTPNLLDFANFISSHFFQYILRTLSCSHLKLHSIAS
jgi:hypothetical protein